MPDQTSWRAESVRCTYRLIDSFDSVTQLLRLVRYENDRCGSIGIETGGLHLFSAELSHLEVDGDEASRGLDEIVGLGIHDDNAVTGAIPAEVGRRNGTKSFLH